jgi:hypothetical protein
VELRFVQSFVLECRMQDVGCGIICGTRDVRREWRWEVAGLGWRGNDTEELQQQ